MAIVIFFSKPSKDVVSIMSLLTFLSSQFPKISKIVLRSFLCQVNNIMDREENKDKVPTILTVFHNLRLRMSWTEKNRRNDKMQNGYNYRDKNCIKNEN